MITIIPLYILGLLQRYGPQHGYHIKKIIGEQLSDFTQIKLPTIYYHLDKMKSEGLLSAALEKPDARPEKTIYTITEKGVEAFYGRLHSILQFDYRPSFPSDSVFYFSEYLDAGEIKDKLSAYIQRLENVISYIRKHKKETLSIVPEKAKTMVIIIFSHHEYHYQAELEWTKESIKQLNK